MALNVDTTAEKMIGARERANARVLLTDLAAGLKATAIPDLDQNISTTYVEAEIQAISDKVDALLAALRVAGLLAT